MNTWVEQWEGALQDRVQEDTPYDLSTYDAYLRWYAPQTRTRLVLAADEPAPRVPAPTDTYPVHFAQDVHRAVRYILLRKLRLSPPSLQFSPCLVFDVGEHRC